MDADELAADGLDEESCDDRGIDAAREGEKNLLIADLCADGGNLLGNEGVGEGFCVDAFHGFGSFVGIHRVCLHPFVRDLRDFFMEIL